MGIATKWPRLLVVGDAVTKEQADEILIRTNQWHGLFSNDKEWLAIVRQVANEYGRPAELDHAAVNAGAALARMRAMDAWEKSLGILELSYLSNWRIMSCWFGGPYGWCDWDGTIGASTFNIGKWPSTAEVTEEWQAIATAFPFLNLRAQCLEDEGAGAVAGTWTVAGGTVDYVDGPAELITEPTEFEFVPMTSAWRERGVEYRRLRQAFRRVADHA